MEITDITSILANSKDAVTDAKIKKVNSEFSGYLENAKRDIYGSEPKESVKAKILEKSHELVSFFYNQVIQTMRKTEMESGLINGGFAEEVFRSMLDMEYSNGLSKQNPSLAIQLYEQLSRNL